ncbi:MAG: hypothetical protein ABSG31_08945 [Tepidisphaeraceae bacterium]|jgi:hypothetical protein
MWMDEAGELARCWRIARIAMQENAAVFGFAGFADSFLLKERGFATERMADHSEQNHESEDSVHGGSVSADRVKENPTAA